MKTTLKIIQYRDGTWGAKKKGWFGWKYFDYVYEGGYTWSYSPPYSYNGGFTSTKTESKQEIVKTLVDYYHYKRKLREADPQTRIKLAEEAQAAALPNRSW